MAPLPPPAAAALAVLFAGIVSAIFGIITLRLADVYYVVGTFALQIILYNISLNWADMTGGSLGLPGIPRPRIGSLEVGDGRAERAGPSTARGNLAEPAPV